MHSRASLLPLLLFGAVCFPQALPVTHGALLSGKEMLVPQDLPTACSVLILGFSKESSKNSAEWRKSISALLGSTNANVTVLQIAVLEDVPRVFRGLVVRGIRQQVPVAFQQSFLLIFENEKEWKKLVSFEPPNDAYVLIADRRRGVVWKTHGTVTSEQTRQMSQVLRICSQTPPFK